MLFGYKLNTFYRRWSCLFFYQDDFMPRGIYARGLQEFECPLELSNTFDSRLNKNQIHALQLCYENCLGQDQLTNPVFLLDSVLTQRLSTGVPLDPGGLHNHC